ncbi:ROK family protein [Dactylosporangium siamense]|uniref:Glucokinase n=1 Tax=Dactylosporangium siamense TaxID=685454 RepID=A0A919U9S4_9ACTN|nr:ROK family protein [Dactylosporangium siamense]GIG42928.1 glucokinase [Dactylosporangium siamense]
MHAPEADSRPVWVLEIGGSHVTAAGVLLDDRKVIQRQRHPLDPGLAADGIVNALAAAAKLLEPHPGDRWAVAMPGPFDYRTGVSLHAGVGKFDSLRGVDLRAALAHAIPAAPDAFTFVNDADSFLLGEWVDGAAKGAARCVAITLGTGIGSAWLADGSVVTTGPDVPPDGEVHFCTIDGVELEEVVSDRALIRAYRSLTGVDVDGMRGLATRARELDAAAQSVIDTAFGALGVLLTDWLTRFKAEVVVFGGSMTGAWDLIEPALALTLPARPVSDTEHAALLGAAWAAAHPTAAVY